MDVVQQLRTASSVLVERMQWLRQMGFSFEGKRDMDTALGYQSVLRPSDYRARYERGGIAGRIVDVLPKATWREGAELIEDESPDVVTEFEKAWAALDNRVRIWPMLLRADLLAAQGRYAVLLLGTPGELSTPLQFGRPEELLYLGVFSEDDAAIATWVTRTADPRFGLPETYTLKRIDVDSADFQKPVHWTRVIHIAEDTLDNETYGQPRLQRVWNLLDSLDKVTGGGAEAFWLRANQGMQLDLDPTVKFDEPAHEDLKKQIDEYEHEMRRVFRTRGVEVKTLGSDVADFSNPADAILMQIAGAIGIPKRLLIGSEMGELASSQDRDNWNTQVQDRRTSFAGPMIVRPLVDRLIAHKYLPAPKQYNVRWPPQQNLSETEIVALAEQKAKINDHFGGREIIEPNEIRETLGLEPKEHLEVDPDRDMSEEQVGLLAAALRKGGMLNLVVKP